MAKLKLEVARLPIELHVQRLARDGLRIRSHHRLQRAPTGVDVLRIRLLIAAEDRQVFVVPLITPAIVVVRRVVPQRPVQQVRVHRVEVRIERAGLRAEVAAAEGVLLLQDRTARRIRR